MLTNDDLRALGKLIDEKITPIKEGQERIEKMLVREVTDLAENIGEIMTKLNKLDKIDEHETRISQLEEDSQFPHCH